MWLTVNSGPKLKSIQDTPQDFRERGGTDNTAVRPCAESNETKAKTKQSQKSELVRRKKIFKNVQKTSTVFYC